MFPADNIPSFLYDMVLCMNYIQEYYSHEDTVLYEAKGLPYGKASCFIKNC